MAYDEGIAELMRNALADETGITEKRMFGGLCFLKDGHMLCGVHPGGGMVRVGKPNHAAALEIPGTRPMMFTGRPMGGFVDADADCIADDARCTRLIALALDFVATLPPK